MANWQESRTLRLEAQRRRAAESLMRCPLCGAINAMTNEECFVCTWHGEFDHDPHRVEAGLDELLIQCPELMDAMMEPPAPAPTRFMRFRTLCARMWTRIARRSA